MKFSIIIPFYNAEKTIARTLASLISNKDYIKEVILIDDNSTDDTREEIEPFKQFFKIKILNKKGKKGPGPSRKQGILAATADWITFVDADDCLTPSSLYYVSDFLQEIYMSDVVLLHTETIYYESGCFDEKSISFSDNSCGGNFYKRTFLIKNELFPHDTLFQSEDEYFNDKIDFYIKRVLKDKDKEQYADWFEYPVYEVHHDMDEYTSFALQNWHDYAIKYHLLKTQYLAEDCLKIKSTATASIEKTFTNGFIFAAYVTIVDNIDIKKYKEDFNNAIDFYIKTFNKTKEEWFYEIGEREGYYQKQVLPPVLGSVGKEKVKKSEVKLSNFLQSFND